MRFSLGEQITAFKESANNDMPSSIKDKSPNNVKLIDVKAIRSTADFSR